MTEVIVRVKQRRLARVRVADQGKGKAMMRQLNRGLVLVAAGRCEPGFYGVIHANELPAWHSGRACRPPARLPTPATRTAPNASQTRERSSGRPGLITSIRRPTQMPSVFSRCMSSPPVSMRRTTAHCRAGSSSSRCSRGIVAVFISIPHNTKHFGPKYLALFWLIVGKSCLDCRFSFVISADFVVKWA